VPIAIGLAGVALAVAVAVWAVTSRPGAPAPPAPARFAIAPSPAQALALTGDRALVLSPDGSHLVHTGARGQLIVRPLNQLDAVPVSGITNARAPFISPDSRWVGYFTGTSGELRKVALAGGSPITLCRYIGSPRGGAWDSDDTIVFATNEPTTGLFRVSARGGAPEPLTTPESAKAMTDDHLLPALLPAGRGVLFTIAATSGGANARLAVLDGRTGNTRS
jgi:serine/threonine-protein kinase